MNGCTTAGYKSGSGGGAGVADGVCGAAEGGIIMAGVGVGNGDVAGATVGGVGVAPGVGLAVSARACPIGPAPMATAAMAAIPHVATRRRHKMRLTFLAQQQDQADGTHDDVRRPCGEHGRHGAALP